MIEYDHEYYRLFEAKYTMSKSEWDVNVRKEWSDHQIKLKLKNFNCYTIIDYDWTKFNGIWFQAFPQIIQLDGQHIDLAHQENINAGEKMLSYIGNWNENADVIEEMYNEINEDGFDDSFLRKNHRYNENGFAIEASDKLLQ